MAVFFLCNNHNKMSGLLFIVYCWIVLLFVFIDFSVCLSLNLESGQGIIPATFLSQSQELKTSKNAVRGARQAPMTQQPESLPDSSCVADGDSDPFRDKFAKNVFSKTFSNDSHTNISVLWTGVDDSVVMVVTMSNSYKPSTLYISKNCGKTFENYTHLLNGSAITSVQQNSVDRRWVIFVAYSDSCSTIFLTTNDSKVERVTLPFKLKGQIQYHPFNRKKLLALGGNDTQLWKAWLSMDGGYKWDYIHNYVSDIQWSQDPNNINKNIFYFTNGSDLAFENVSKKEYDLVKAFNLSKLCVIAHRVRTFKITGQFLYALVYANESRMTSILRVSTNGGQRWNEAQLPVMVEDQFYEILDMSEGMVSIHVDQLKVGYGKVFTSDADGIVFSEALQGHLYSKDNSANDFYKVKSMRGVYITSVFNSDKKVITVISYNRGAKWSALRKPLNVNCSFIEPSKCSLQIASRLETAKVHNVQEPLSTKSAVGIILAHGYVGQPLPNKWPDVYVSSDGGYNWTKALNGPHLYAIADHGGLLVAVSAAIQQPSDHVKFSLDEGETWYCYQFTNDKIRVTGLLTDPESWSLKVGIWGYGMNDSVWRVTVIDFQQIIERQCKEPNDFSDFTAHNEMSANDKSQQGCLLGVRETFRKVKRGSRCYLGSSHTVNKSTEHCKCTEDDYECDYGFYRPRNRKQCVENPHFKGAELDICLDGEEHKIVTLGYRKIPGDVCEQGFYPGERYEKSIKLKCREGDKILLGSLHLGPSGSATGLVILVVLIMAMTSLIFGMSVFFIRKFQQIHASPITYRYSRLNQEDYQDDDEAMCIVSHNTQPADEDEHSVDENLEAQPATLLVDTSDVTDTFASHCNGTSIRTIPKKYLDESDEELLQ